jgi:hypothetical protein
MPRFMAAALAVWLCAPASAHAFTVLFSGTVAEAVSDDSGLLDDSVALGTTVTGSYEVDPSNLIGTSPFAVGPARLAFQLGNYAFDAQDPHTISLIDDRIVDPGTPPNPPITVDVWQSGAIVASDLSPATQPGGGFAGYAAQIEFFDFTSTAFNGGETEPFVPADLTGWSQVRLDLNSLVSSGGGPPSIDERVHVHVRIESWSIVPEPRAVVLLALGLVLIAARAR